MDFKMLSKYFAVFCFIPLVLSEEITKKSDSQVSGADFVPHFQTFQFPAQPVFAAPQDLTALQQTHVLGNFHHRFHPTRLTPQFGVSPPLVFTPQTHIVPPQPAIVQNQIQQSLVPPQPLQNHHDILHPVGLVPPQQNINAQNFKTPPTQKPTFPTPNDQSIKNSFPSNAPHTIKFSISSVNYNPNQAKQQVNPPTLVNHQQSSSVPSGRFITTPQVQQHRPIVNQPTNFHQASFNDATRAQQTNFQSFNLNKPEVGINHQGFGTQNKFFGPSPIPTAQDFTSQFQKNVAHSNNHLRPQQTNDVSSISILPSVGNINNFQPRPTETQPQFTQTAFTKSNFEMKQSNFPQNQFNQQQFVQSNFDFSQSQKPNLNILQATPQTQFQFQPAEQLQQSHQQTQFNIQPSIQSNFEFRPTEQPRAPSPDNFPRKQDIQIPQNPPQSVPPSESAKERLVLQKSQDKTQYTFPGSFAKGEVSPSPSPTTVETLTTISTKYRKPKPIVKEITINLNDQKISGDIPAQLYIKEDREKEFQEIKAQDSKERKGKKEKTQEDIINEQIQKLLQSHNLEIIDKDNDSQTESQEAQLSQFSEQFKKYNYSVQLLNGGSLLREVKPKKKIPTTLPPLPELPEHIKKQYDIKLVSRDDLFKQFDLPGNHKLANDSSVFLADGQQLELVKFSKDGIMNKIPIGTKAIPTTSKPPKVLFEELTKGVIPPGADFELIKHKGDGQVEKVNDLTSAKEVTFVFLEEQPDGSVKIQGVKGNTNQEKRENETVDSLIKKIKDGSLKLPPSKQGAKGLLTNEIPRINPATQRNYVTFSPVTTPAPRSIHPFPATSIPFYEEKDATDQANTADFSYSSPYAVDIDATLTPTPFYETTPEPPTTFLPTVNYIRSSTRKPKTRSRITFLPTLPSADPTPTFGSKRIKTTTAKSPLFKNFVSSRKAHKPYTKAPKYEDYEYTEREILSHKPTEYSPHRLKVPQEDVVAEESNIDSVRPINEILRENGLKEMAKFLDQSGLDTILNETGPYTIFIPTDKAFRTLQDQLGGPDKAEDKFKENPRLLSGLLLHHVVPGSFRLEDLQDEMTGVSLAGTQLRVNTYEPEDKNASEERIVTINGARVSNGKKDILVPQGLAHAIDRVLFPLPVGDIVQTLRGDRERRFTKFLKSLESSGLTDILTGTKTYTVFAPTDKAFAVLTDSELDKLLTRREAARTIVLRHIVPGTLYSAGMNYYQVKESMEEGQKIVIKKELDSLKLMVEAPGGFHVKEIREEKLCLAVLGITSESSALLAGKDLLQANVK